MQSYLPCKESTDTNDAQDVEHSRAHNGPDTYVTLGDEDTCKHRSYVSLVFGPVALYCGESV